MRKTCSPIDLDDTLLMIHCFDNFCILCQNIENNHFEGLDVITAPGYNRFEDWGNDYSSKYIVLNVGNIVNGVFFLKREEFIIFCRPFPMH